MMERVDAASLRFSHSRDHIVGTLSDPVQRLTQRAHAIRLGQRATTVSDELLHVQHAAERTERPERRQEPRAVTVPTSRGVRL